MRTSLPACIVLASCLASVGAHQTPPDLSGRWIVEPETIAPPGTAGPPPQGDMGSGWGPSITISQDATRLVVEHALFTRYDLQPPLRSVFLLDGSEARNSLMIGHTTQVRSSRALWEGATLRITTLYPAIDPESGKAVTTQVTHRLSLETPGVLVIHVTRSASLGGRETTTRTVYRKN